METKSATDQAASLKRFKEENESINKSNLQMKRQIESINRAKDDK